MKNKINVEYALEYMEHKRKWKEKSFAVYQSNQKIVECRIDFWGFKKAEEHASLIATAVNNFLYDKNFNISLIIKMLVKKLDYQQKRYRDYQGDDEDIIADYESTIDHLIEAIYHLKSIA